MENFIRVTDHVSAPCEHVIPKGPPKNLRNHSGNSKMKPGTI